VLFAHNVARSSSVASRSCCCRVFDDRPGSSQIEVYNTIPDSSKPHHARLGALCAAGIGILHVGVDDSKLVNNRIEGNEFGGIAIVDYCLVAAGTPFNCSGGDPSVAPEFIADQDAANTRGPNMLWAACPSGSFAHTP
jgi:hypothetical protein